MPYRRWLKDGNRSLAFILENRKDLWMKIDVPSHYDTPEICLNKNQVQFLIEELQNDLQYMVDEDE